MKSTSLTAAVALLVTLASSYAAAARGGDSAKNQARLFREVRHELVTLPYYGVFDNLAYNVKGGTVTLSGQVTQPTLKASAEKSVKEIEGVEKVDNQIEVLPLSPMDDQIRIAVYRAIYGQSSLNRYAMQAVPPIHIIVKNGSITLVGAVANEMDKILAGTQANSVPGAFAVTNQLATDTAARER